MVSLSANGEDSTTHASIRIEGNDQFASVARAENWPGEGTADDPYIIENLTFLAKDEEVSFYIANTSCHFIINNCTFNGDEPEGYQYGSSGIGISCVNGTSGRITNISCNYLSKGVELIQFNYSQLINIHGNLGSRAVMITRSSDDLVERVSGYSYVGPRLIITQSNNVTISNTSGSTQGGCTLSLSYSRDVTICDCDFSSMHGYGMDINYCDDVCVENCIMNTFDSMFVTGSNNNTFQNNTLRYVYLYVSNDNSFLNNRNLVLAMEGSDRNVIGGNKISNLGLEGVRMAGSSFNAIYNNSIEGPVYLESSDNNSIRNNTIHHYWSDFSDEGYGIGLHVSFSNTIVGNAIIGTKRDDPTSMNYARPYSKSLVQAFDDGSNTWNSSTGGNFWNDWTCPDKNNDGIVDHQYLINGGDNSDRMPIAGDRLDLVYSAEPSLTIVSPSDREEVRAATVTIAWNASYDPSEAFMSVMVDGGEWQYLGITSKVTLDLDEGEHTVQVAACDQNGEHQLLESVTFVFEPLTSEPSEPSLVWCSSEEGCVNLSWAPPSLRGDSVTYYAVYRDGVVIATTTNTWYNDTEVEPGGLHGYYITAFNVNGESEASRMMYEWLGPLAIGYEDSDDPSLISDAPSPDPGSDTTSLPSDGSGSLTTGPVEGDGNHGTAQAITIGSTLIAVAAVGAVLLRPRKT